MGEQVKVTVGGFLAAIGRISLFWPVSGTD